MEGRCTEGKSEGKMYWREVVLDERVGEDVLEEKVKE